MTPRVSVVIPTYNSVQTLRPCIESIYKQSIKPYEVIIIDNASTDNTWKAINEYFPKAKKIRMNLNTGVTGGRNEGIRNLSQNSNYVFFFDHDMVADNKMLEESLRAFDLGHKVGIVTPKIYYWDNKNRIWSAGTGINLWTGQVIFRGGQDVGQYNVTEEVQVAPAAMLVKREVLKKVRQFDNRYYATYEDTDFCFRAKKYGFATFYSPDSIAYHKIPSNPKQETERLLSRYYWIARNRIIFMKKFGKFTFWFFLPIFGIYYLYLALKFKKFNPILMYMKGSLAGIFN